MMPMPEHVSGASVWYAPFVMEATARARGMSLDGYLDGVALMSPADLGKEVWITNPTTGEWEGPYLSVDVAQQNHICVCIVVRGEVVEVGWRTWERWGLTNKDWKVQVEVSTVPPDELSGAPIDYVVWWARHARLWK